MVSLHIHFNQHEHLAFLSLSRQLFAPSCVTSSTLSLTKSVNKRRLATITMIRVSSSRLCLATSSFKGFKNTAPAILRCNLAACKQISPVVRCSQIRGLSTANEDNEEEPAVLYEGPFAALTLRLKRVSLTSAVIGIVGLPALSFFYGAADSVPATGQLGELCMC